MFAGLLLLIVAFVLSCLSGYMSVIGMAALFPGGGWVIMAMMAALEVSKLVIAGWLHANWAKKTLKWLHKAYLLAAVLVLMTLTSVGIFGNLSKDHLEQEAPVAGVEIKIAQIQQRITQSQADRKQLDGRQAQLDAQINTILGVSKNTKDVAKSQKIQASQKKERDQLRKDMTAKDDEINKLTDALVPLKLQISDVSAKLGPIKYVANLFGWTDTEKAVDMIILMIMFAFDPLAVVSVLSAVFSFGEWGAKRRAAKEAKAAAQVSKPLDMESEPRRKNREFEPMWSETITKTTTTIVEPTEMKPEPVEVKPVPKADLAQSIVNLTKPVGAPAPVSPAVPPPEPVSAPPVPEVITVEEKLETPPAASAAPLASVPENLVIKVEPSPYMTAYGTIQPLYGRVDVAPIAVDQDPTFLGGYQPPEVKSDRQHLLELLGEHPEVLEQVRDIIEEDHAERTQPAAPLPVAPTLPTPPSWPNPHANDAPTSMFPPPEPPNKLHPETWLGKPWFPEE